MPAAKDKQEAVMEQIGQDGSRLLSELWREQTPSSLRALPEIEGLRKTWTQQFFWQEGVLRLRNKDGLPPAHLTVRSPYDHHAHYGHKRDLAWFGYKVHFSETCDEDLPHLITHVVTTDATTTDMEQTGAIHQALKERGLAPGEHVLDAGYVDAETILQGRVRYGIEVIGPVSQNNQWQAKKGGYDASQFTIDWQAKLAVCPQDKTSVKWAPGTDQYGHPNISIRFGLHDCRACMCRSLCTRSTTNPRMLTIRQQAEFEILQQTRLRQQTDEFRARYAQRAGIEGTHSQAVRSLGLRRTRYCGLPKTALSHFFTAAAINLVRLDAFLEGKKAAKTRVSRFAALAPDELAS